MKRKKRDRSMLPYAVGVLVFFVLFGSLVVWAMGYRQRYKSFNEKLAQDVLYSRDNKSLYATVDGYSGPVDYMAANDVQLALAGAGMGKEYKDALPDTEEGILLEFGNGNSLFLKRASIRLAGGEYGPGVLIVYRERSGAVYAYDTDGFSYSSVYYSVRNAIKKQETSEN